MNKTTYHKYFGSALFRGVLDAFAQIYYALILAWMKDLQTKAPIDLKLTLIHLSVF